MLIQMGSKCGWSATKLPHWKGSWVGRTVFLLWYAIAPFEQFFPIVTETTIATETTFESFHTIIFIVANEQMIAWTKSPSYPRSSISSAVYSYNLNEKLFLCLSKDWPWDVRWTLIYILWTPIFLFFFFFFCFFPPREREKGSCLDPKQKHIWQSQTCCFPFKYRVGRSSNS